MRIRMDHSDLNLNRELEKCLMTSDFEQKVKPAIMYIILETLLL